jgi:hypothetical protein
LKDDPHPGQLSPAHNEQSVAQVCEKIHADHRLTIQDISEEVNIYFGSC